MLIIPLMLLVLLAVYLKARHAIKRVNHLTETNDGPKSRQAC